MKPNFDGRHGTRADHREQEAAAAAAHRRANGLAAGARFPAELIPHAHRRANGLAAGARFPAELIPHAAARRLLESLGVTIVHGDAELIERARR